MPARDIKAGGSYVELMLRDRRFLAGLANAGRRLARFTKAAVVAGAAVVAAGVAAGAVAVRNFITYGDTLDKMSKRTGVSVEALSELKHAAELSGASIETLEKGFAGLSRSLFNAGRGSAEAVDALAALGLTIDDLQGLNPEEQMSLVADGIASIADESTRGAVAQKLFGRAGRQLLPMLRDGKAGMDALRQSARDAGLTMSTEAAGDAATLLDELTTLKSELFQISVGFGAFVAPLLNRLLPAIRTLSAGVRDEFGKAGEFLGSFSGDIGKTVNAFIDALAGGDLVLAGQIEFAALRLALLQGVDKIASVVGGRFGEFIADMGGKIAGGDFAGAWDTTVLGMAAAWDMFVSGVVNTFGEGIRKVVSLWESTTQAISGFLLKDATEGGFLGKLALSGTGVNMQDEKARAERLDAELRARGANIGPTDFLGDVQRDAAQQLSGTADAVRKWLDEAPERAKESAEKFNEEIAKGAAEASHAVADAEAELERLRELAAKNARERNKQASKEGPGLGDDGLNSDGMKNKIFGSFTAAALAVQGTTETLTAREVRKLRNQQQLQLRELIAAAQPKRMGN